MFWGGIIIRALMTAEDLREIVPPDETLFRTAQPKDRLLRIHTIVYTKEERKPHVRSIFILKLANGSFSLALRDALILRMTTMCLWVQL